MTKTVRCKECGTQIAVSAKTCPQCGAKQKQIDFIFKIFLALGVFFIMLQVYENGGKLFSLEQSSAKLDLNKLSANKAETGRYSAVFDVPLLMGKNYIEMKKLIGEPTKLFIPTQAQISIGESYSATWKKESISLQADFVRETDPIRYFFVDNNSTNSYSKEQLRILANVKDSNSVKVVSQSILNNSRSITGIHVCSASYRGEKTIIGSENCR